MKIEFRHVNKSFGELSVLRDVSFPLSTGEILVICGESGRGKTTLLRVLAGFEAPDGGEIRLDETMLTAQLRPDERHMAMAFQEPALWNHLTVRKNLSFVRDKKKTYRRSIEAIAEDLEIGELLERMPGKISGGQAKRVALARALAAEKEILLLDEPLANVDPARKERILTRLKETYFPHCVVLYVTHDEREAELLGGHRLELKSE